MWWEIRRVSYDLRAGVIIRQLTINVKKQAVDFQKGVSLNQHQPDTVQFTVDVWHFIPV